MQKGQYYRLLIGTLSGSAVTYTPIGAAKELTLHVSSQVEESSTKDTTGDWQEQEVVGLSYDITSSQIVLDDEDTLISNGVDTLETLYKSGSQVYWKICTASGTNNRVFGSTPVASGVGYISQLQINAANRQNATCQMTLQGYGSMSIAS